MSLKKYLLVMIAITLFAWLLNGLVILNVNPFTTNWLGFTLFYATIFLALLATAAVVVFAVRFLRHRDQPAFQLVRESFRQSFFFAFLVAAAFFLLSKRMLSWLNLALLILALSVLEFIFLNKKKFSSKSS